MKHPLLVALTWLGLLCLPTFAVAQNLQSTEQMASYYYQNKEYDKAVVLYEQLYTRTQNKYYYSLLYEMYVATNQLREAERLVERRMKQRPAELECYVDLGELQLRRGDKRKASRTFAAAIEKQRFDAQQTQSLADAFASAGLLDLAVKTYQTARERSGNPLQYVMELAALYERSGNYESMMQEYFDLLDASPASMNNIQVALQRMLRETSNPQLAEGLRKTLVSRVQTHPENAYYTSMMIWFSLQQNDFAFAFTQAKAVDARLHNDASAEQVYRVAQIAQHNADYATAIAAYRHLLKYGTTHPFYLRSRVGELETRFAQLDATYALSSDDLSHLCQDYAAALDELGKNVQTLTLLRNYAHLLAYNVGRLQEASDLLYDALELPHLHPHQRDETKLELGDLLLFAGEVWDASLLYSQVEKSNKEDLLGAQAKFKNAQLSYYTHNFAWAKSQLDVLRASTSKLIANDAMQLSLLISDNMEDDSTYTLLERYATADLLLYRGRLDDAWDAYEDVEHHAIAHSLFDEVLLQKARIRMKQGRYAEADTLLERLVNLYPSDILADDALMTLAELNDTRLRNPQRARACYERLLLDYPTSLYADRARQRFAALRRELGD